MTLDQSSLRNNLKPGPNSLRDQTNSPFRTKVRPKATKRLPSSDYRGSGQCSEYWQTPSTRFMG